MASEFTKHNEVYVKEQHKPNLPIPPSKQLLIVTCMDARIDAFAALGLQQGEAHVVRNAGGRAQEAIRSIIISQRLLGAREIATEQLRNTVKKDIIDDATKATIDNIQFLEFGDLEESVREDVKFLQENPLVLKDTKVTGWVFQVEDGKLVQIV